MPQGELHIRDVSASDAGTKYKCKTIHQLTSDTQVSTASGQLFVNGKCGKK